VHFKSATFRQHPQGFAWEPKIKFGLFNSKEEGKMELIKRLFRDENGATAIEYGLLAALISVAIIGAVTIVGGKLVTTFTTVSTALP
jgi:pilus assembly protein Flp/PilA